MRPTLAAWRIASLALSALMLATSACLHHDESDADRARPALSQARQKWQASGIVSYDYYLRKLCFCEGGDGREVLISVRDGVIERVRYAGSGEDVAREQYRFYVTVPGLFETVQWAIDRSAHAIRAEYDPALGYPTFVFTDDIAGAVDDEQQYDARDLTPI